ncbi:MAG: ice-binding family protein, partial [Prolixibacteraceae bacterium]|nr:ice-binding family protein [Prolixibacteraceae bacterium]
MKTKLLNALIAVFLFLMPTVIFGQTTPPTLGVTSDFALFTSAGALTTDGATVVTGDIGSYDVTPVGFTGPGTVIGTIYPVGAILDQAVTDMDVAWGNFSADGDVLGTPLETFNITGYIYPGTYHTTGAAALNGDFTLDAQGDPDALFVININGAFTVGADFDILLADSAQFCNVYWQIDGGFILGARSNFMGTIVSNGAITLLEEASLHGRALTNSGAINLHNNVVSFMPAIGLTVGGASTICSGTGTNITVALSEVGVNYQLRNDNANELVGSSVAGTGSTINLPTGTLTTTTTYNVLATNACGSVKLTETEVVTVNPTTGVTSFTAGATTVCQDAADETYTATAANSTSIAYSVLPVVAGVINATTGVINWDAAFSGAATITATSTGLCGTTSADRVVTVNPLPTAFVGVDRTICLDENTTLGEVELQGSTYNWTSLPAGYTSIEANPTVSPQETTIFTLTETITASGCMNTNDVTVTVNNPPIIITEPADQSGCAGCSSVSFSVTATGTGLTYQWRNGDVNLTNGGNISGATSAILTINPVGIYDSSSNYNVVVTGICDPNATSINTSLTVNTPPYILAGPENQIANEGSPVSFSVTATGTDVTYQWRKGEVNLTDGGKISGATTATLTINPVSVTDAASDYNVVITRLYLPDETSRRASLIVNTAPVITTEPVNQTGCIGCSSSVSFYVIATGTGLTYQWRKGSVNLNDGGNISGATTAILTINPVSVADIASNYNVIISGSVEPSATSTNVSLTINDVPGISSEPVSQTECAGNAVSFSVAATGANNAYQWRRGETNLSNEGNISG